MSVYKKLSAIIAGMALPFFANSEGDKTGWQFGLGASYQYERSLFRFDDNDHHGSVIPIIEYRGSWYSISPLEISADLFHAEQGDWGLDISAALTPGYGLERNDDSRIFDGMSDREYATEASINIDVTTPIGVFGTGVSRDIGDTYKGSIGEVYYYLPVYGTENSQLIVNLGSDFLSQDYIDYYYGVRDDEVNALRSAYSGESARSDYIGYVYQLKLSQHWSVSHELTYRKIPEEIRQSPLTEADKDQQLSTSVAIYYMF